LGTRRVPVSGIPKHLISYKVEGREVFLLRVIHGARDLENLFAG
jgi:plasmid stabilization system protein ParE